MSLHKTTSALQPNLSGVSSSQSGTTIARCYVQEQGRGALDTFVGEAYRVLKSVVARVGRRREMRTIDEREVKRARESTKYKTGTGRNVLGVRILLEDWIHGLEIGHVMQLNPMLASELSTHSQTNVTQSIDSQLSSSAVKGIHKYHEMLKDPMLEKLVLLIVSMFSIATEMRLQHP